jgi:UDP-3-O-[3-hydroxymyristoyl] N-acetylglucosamine deacetylase
MKGAKQTTLRDQVAVSGIGVHSGEPVTLTLLPGDDDTGIVFQRVKSDGSVAREVRADVRAVTATEFATVLGDAKGPLCSTAEHLLAALRGLNVDNVIVEIDGPEVPIMDGSAAAFVEALDQAGLTRARSRAATSKCSSRCASRAKSRSASFVLMRTASVSKRRSISITR